MCRRLGSGLMRLVGIGMNQQEDSRTVFYNSDIAQHSLHTVDVERWFAYFPSEQDFELINLFT